MEAQYISAIYQYCIGSVTSSMLACDQIIFMVVCPVRHHMGGPRTLDQEVIR